MPYKMRRIDWIAILRQEERPLAGGEDRLGFDLLKAKDDGALPSFRPRRCGDGQGANRRARRRGLIAVAGGRTEMGE